MTPLLWHITIKNDNSYFPKGVEEKYVRCTQSKSEIVNVDKEQLGRIF